MTEAVRFPLVLGIVTLCSAAGLAVSYTLTRDEIRLQEELKKARGLAAVFGVALDEARLQQPDADLPWQAFAYSDRKGDPDGTFVVSEAIDPATGACLYAGVGRAQGYSSKVEVVVAVDQAVENGLDGATIRAIKIVKQLETPGLGSNCARPEFQRQFTTLPYAMLRLVKGVPFRKPDAEGSEEQPVVALTGATVTSNAVIGAVRQALERVRHHVATRQSTH